MVRALSARRFVRLWLFAASAPARSSTHSTPVLQLELGRGCIMTVEETLVKTLLLTGPITLYEVSAVCESLRMALSEGKPLRIDLSDSGPWDLCRAAAPDLVRFRAHGIATWRFAWPEVPEVCAQVAERCGLSGWLLSVREVNRRDDRFKPDNPHEQNCPSCR